MRLSEEDLTNIFKKLLNLVKRKPPEFFNFRKMTGTVGLCYWTDIELDYRRDLVPTAMHELVHYLYPDWTETEVRYTESRLINFCTPLEVATFLKYLSIKLYKSEELKDRLSKQKPARKNTKTRNLNVCRPLSSSTK